MQTLWRGVEVGTGLFGPADEMSFAALIIASTSRERPSDGAFSGTGRPAGEMAGTRSVLCRPVGVIYVDHTER
jgi:hypothetical protein